MIVHDDIFSFLTRNATSVQPHIAIDSTTKTVKDGALWFEESLPPETLLKIIKLGAGVQRFVRGEANAAPPERWADVGPPPPATPSHED